MKEKDLFEKLTEGINIGDFKVDQEGRDEHDEVEAKIIRDSYSDLSDISESNLKLEDFSRIMVQEPKCNSKSYENVLDQKLAVAYRDAIMLMRFMYVEMSYLYLVTIGKRKGSAAAKKIYEMIISRVNFYNFHHVVYYDVCVNLLYYAMAVSVDMIQDKIRERATMAFLASPSNKNFADLAFVMLGTHTDPEVRRVFDLYSSNFKFSITEFFEETENVGGDFLELFTKHLRRIDEAYYYNDVFKKLIELYMIEPFNKYCIKLTPLNDTGFLF